LFDTALKKAIPAHPKQIGIVTSPDAAALHDVLTTLRRRMPNIPVVIYPTPVQGKGAATQIAHAINSASQRDECDVLIICRGGGSIEDLWQFNEEVVARAIANCHIPTISGVGHETDFTICDFVADVRAPTPTAAAELASPSREALFNKLKQLGEQLKRNSLYLVQQREQLLDYLARRLVSPTQQVALQTRQLEQLRYRLGLNIQQQLQRQQRNLRQLAQNLHLLNPQAVLSRGYAFAQNKQGEIIRNSLQIKAGDDISLTFDVGSAEATITQTRHDN
jgi:exodeoxyribonuclease VII large subunit